MNKSKMLARVKGQSAEQNAKLRADVATAINKNASDASAQAWQSVFAEIDSDEATLQEYGLIWRKKGQKDFRFGYHEGVEVISIAKDGGNHGSDIKEVWQIYIKGKPFYDLIHKVQDARRLSAEQFFKS